ncbi:MAG: glycosyltransferase [Candidatus Rokubacteria bacterium]|nr:glycosyltransferase [Candidatus Rokubacteria bacterium]
MTLRGAELVALYCEPWDSPLRTSKHHFLAHLARANRVLYVEMPIHPLSALRHGDQWRRAVRRVGRGPLPVGDGLAVLTPACPLPYHRGSWLTSRLAVNALNQRAVLPQLRRAMGALGLRRPILWFYFPHAASLLDRVPHCLAAYHLVDDFTAMGGIPPTLATLERQLLARADLVVATSRRLYETRRPLCREIHLVRHGAFVSEFARAADPATRVPEELRRLPRPIVGYYGALHKLDLGLLRQVAVARPGWSFALIGPTEGSQGADLSAMRGLANVHLLGPRPFERLPDYLRGFDVAMMPFKVEPLTEAMCPIKMFEFLAAGKPVVSTDLPEVREMGDLIWRASDADGFLRCLEAALADGDPGAGVRRQAAARAHAWPARFAELEGLLVKALAARAGDGGS